MNLVLAVERYSAAVKIQSSVASFVDDMLEVHSQRRFFICLSLYLVAFLAAFLEIWRYIWPVI